MAFVKLLRALLSVASLALAGLAGLAGTTGCVAAAGDDDTSGEDFCVSASCGWASDIFVRRRLATWPGVTRVYGWDMASSQKGGWNSALADHDGKYRAMFCGLMGYSKKAFLEKSKGAEQGPWRRAARW